MIKAGKYVRACARVCACVCACACAHVCACAQSTLRHAGVSSYAQVSGCMQVCAACVGMCVGMWVGMCEGDGVIVCMSVNE
jgi:hypothetical protein